MQIQCILHALLHGLWHGQAMHLDFYACSACAASLHTKDVNVNLSGDLCCPSHGQHEVPAGPLIRNTVILLWNRLKTSLSVYIERPVNQAEASVEPPPWHLSLFPTSFKTMLLFFLFITRESVGISCCPWVRQHKFPERFPLRQVCV